MTCAEVTFNNFAEVMFNMSGHLPPGNNRRSSGRLNDELAVMMEQGRKIVRRRSRKCTNCLIPFSRFFSWPTEVGCEQCPLNVWANWAVANCRGRHFPTNSRIGTPELNVGDRCPDSDYSVVSKQVQMRSVGLHLTRYNRTEDGVILHKSDKWIGNQVFTHVHWKRHPEDH